MPKTIEEVEEMWFEEKLAKLPREKLLARLTTEERLAGLTTEQKRRLLELYAKEATEQ